jgi:hypothetical protein
MLINTGNTGTEETTFMTATYLQPAFTTLGSSSAFAALKATVIEPFLVIAVSAFWLIVLPFAALFSAAIAISDKVESLKTREVRVAWSYRLGFRAETRPLLS